MAVAAGPASGADKPQEPKEPQTIMMTVRPVAPPRPALKYRLLPTPVEQTPGNAVPHYLRAAGLYPQGLGEHADKLLTDEEARRFGLPDNKDAQHTWSTLFLAVPLDRLAADPPELRPFLGDSGTFEMLELAARRESATWDLPLREQGFSTLLPHLNSMRSLSRLVCVRARRHLAKGDPDAAVRTLRINIALARALNGEAVLVQQLVAVSIVDQGLKVLQEAAGRPDGPNLYWALGGLPRPMLDVAQALEMERAALYWTLPALRKVKDGTFTDADWRTLMRRFGEFPSLTAGAAAKPSPLPRELEAVGAAVLLYPSARQYLIDHGTPADRVDALPRTSVVARYLVESYEETYDDLIKWALLPYWQGRAGQGRAEPAFVRRAKASSNPLLAFVPAVLRATYKIARLDRQIAAQQTVEALRAYAADHGGALPKSLDEIADTPAPPDPFTGKPFVYKVDGATATLESLDADRPADGLVVKVTMAK